MAHWLDGWLLDPKDLLVSTPSQRWNSKLILPHPAFLIKKISIIIRTLNSVFMIVWPSTLPIANIECKNCVHLLEIANGKDLGCTSHGFHISTDRYFFDMHTSTLFCLFWLIPVSFSVLVFIYLLSIFCSSSLFTRSFLLCWGDYLIRIDYRT